MKIDFSKPIKTCQGGDCQYLGRSAEPNETHPHIVRMPGGEIKLYDDRGVARGLTKRGLYQEDADETKSRGSKIDEIMERLDDIDRKIDRLLIAFGEDVEQISKAREAITNENGGLKL